MHPFVARRDGHREKGGMVWRPGRIYPALVPYQGRLPCFHAEKLAMSPAPCPQIMGNSTT